MVKMELQDILAGGLCPVFLGYECPRMVQWTLQWVQFGAVARLAIRSQSNWTSARWDGASHPVCSGGKMGWNSILGRLYLYFVHMMNLPFSATLFSEQYVYKLCYTLACVKSLYLVCQRCKILLQCAILVQNYFSCFISFDRFLFLFVLYK